MPLDFEILGSGIYTPRQAARLLGSSYQEVLRWTRGSPTVESLWDAHYRFLNGATELNFSDLIELRVVKAFKRAGVSLQAIRFAIELAELKFDVKYPLSTKIFKTDGSEILMESLEKDGNLVSMSKKRPGQNVFAKVVEQSLNDLEFEDGKSVRWRPSQKIVIDPGRNFGAPILDDFGIETGVLFREFQEFQDMKYLASIYEIPVNFVRDAIDFEKNLEMSSRDIN